MQDGKQKFYLFTSTLSDIPGKVWKSGMGVYTLIREEDTLRDVSVGRWLCRRPAKVRAAKPREVRQS